MVTNKNEDKIIESTEKIRVGTPIIRHLSTTFYPNPQMIFDELISNSRDAMATIVKLFIGEESIIIEDNGEGMTRDELIHFFFISYSDKPSQPIKKKGDLKREVIGRFGIGKLSLFQICSFFEITSIKDKSKSKAVFNFDEFEKEKFVDDFSLNVVSSEASYGPTGTKIVLKGLKRKLSAKIIKRHLTRTMPLTKDFKVIIEGVGLHRPVELRSEDVMAGNVFKNFKIDEFVEGVGPIKGFIGYKRRETREHFGIFLRVFNRLVNLNNPHGVINFSNLTHARQFARRIYADLNVNGLNEALQTNRAGFITNNSSYVKFQAWLKTRLNKLNTEVNNEWMSERKTFEREYVEDTVSRLFAVKPDETLKPFLEKKRNLELKSGDPKEIKKEIEPITYVKSKLNKEIPKKKDSLINTMTKYDISVEPLGITEPEALLDKKKKIISINSLHPLYELSRKKGGVWGVQYHSIRAAIVIVALEFSTNLGEFRENYDRLLKESQKVAGSIQRRIVII